MMTRRFPQAIGLSVALVLLLAAAGCAAYHGAVGIHYGRGPAAYPSVVYGSSFYLGRGVYQVVYQPDAYGYYFRTRALGPGHGCSRYCYARGRDVYHHSSCRRFGSIARRYRTHASSLIRAYGPR